MGREVKDICMDMEPNTARVNSKDGASVVENHDRMNSIGQAKAGHKAHVLKEKNESKDYEVKECTAEYSDEINDLDRVENDNEEHEEKVVHNGTHKQGNTKKSGSRSTATGNARSHYTVPQPFELATEKRASSGSRPSVPETKPQVTPISPLASKKLHPDSKKHIEEEDVSSDASSIAASVKTLKGKVTVGSAPTFKCSERAEKRKEFYSKLEEKQQALEAERTQCEARTKEEQEAALKQLRKSLVFKANPMPTFYHEGPPPKVELKKVPPTRAKSPKLSRRKSCGDAVRDDKGGSQVPQTRQSLGSYRRDASISNKDRTKNQSEHITSKTKDGLKQIKQNSKPDSPKSTMERNTEISVQ